MADEDQQSIWGSLAPDLPLAAKVAMALNPLTGPAVLGRAVGQHVMEGYDPSKPVPNPLAPFGLGVSGERDDPVRTAQIEQAVPMAEMAVGLSAPFAARGALGSGGGRLIQPSAPAIEAPAGIRAYHGSPHDFDRFDMSKIGTGEGAQVYGHGLYFAEAEPTAKAYRDALSGRSYVANNGDRLPGGHAFELVNTAMRDAAPGLHPDQYRGIADQLFNGIEQHGSAAKFLRDYELPGGMFAKASNAASEWATARGLKTNKGRMYEVDINARPDQFLDWDKPLAQMGEPVKKALGDAWLAHPIDHAHQTGGQIYESARIVPGEYRDPMAATKTLQDAGIPGIKYLDQGSRFHPSALPNNPIANEARQFLEAAKGDSAAALKAFQESGPVARWGQGEREEVRRVIEAAGVKPTSNYVLFNSDLVKILRKYAITAGAPLGATAAAFGSLGPQEK